MASLNIILQLLKKSFALLYFLNARLDGFLSSFGPCCFFITKFHAIGRHRKCGIQGSLWVLHLKTALEIILLFGLGDLLLDLEAASDLRLDVVEGAPVLLADDLLGVSLSSHSAKSFGQDSRFLEIPDILLGDALLLAQILDHVIVLLSRKFLLLRIGNNKSVRGGHLLPNRGHGKSVTP